MPSAIPIVLAPYIQQHLATPSQVLITSVLDTSAHWLVLRFIHAALNGVDEGPSRSQNKYAGNGDAVSGDFDVVFVSFIRPFEFWLEIGKKIGLDLASLHAKKQLAYIDGLVGGLSAPSSGTTTNVVRLKSHAIRDIHTAITTTKQGFIRSGTTPNRQIIIIDGMDFVLASQPDTSASEAALFFLTLQEQFSNVVVVVAADSPLMHNTEPSATPLELNHSIFTKALAHQSQCIMQLRPLETGHARDVSGVIRISNTTSSSGVNDELSDSEWLYQTKGDGSVKVWGRGE